MKTKTVNKTAIVLGFTILSILAAGCSFTEKPASQPEAAEEAPTSRIYVSVVLQTEELTKPQHLRFVEEETMFRRYRRALLEFTHCSNAKVATGVPSGPFFSIPRAKHPQRISMLVW
jgi:hypothetical protein